MKDKELSQAQTNVMVALFKKYAHLVPKDENPVSKDKPA